MYSNFIKRFVLFIKGMSMGIADIIPGVSGGTIAIITGIYEELLLTLNKLDFKIFNLLFQFKLKKIWQYYNLNFLVTLVSGILTSVFLFSNYISFLIENYSIGLWSFFLYYL